MTDQQGFISRSCIGFEYFKGLNLQNKIELLVGLFVLVALGILGYMSFQVGAFRFDSGCYSTYFATFSDATGLSRKAQVKIAGVTVGWVEDVDLIWDGQSEARARLKVHRDYCIAQDAYATIRQDGLLGPKYVEISPGDPRNAKLKSGSLIMRPATEPASMDAIMNKVSSISSNIEGITDSLRYCMAGAENVHVMKELFENLSKAAQKIASISEAVDQSITRNRSDLDNVFQIGSRIAQLSEQIESSLLPAFKENIDRVSNKLETSIEALEEASVQVRDGFRTVNSVAEKIDDGKGLIGKLINEDETYRDLTVAARGIKQYFARVDMLQIVFDTHFESMYRPAEYYTFEDSKGYFDVRIHPNEDHFYLLQIAASEKGIMQRKERKWEFSDKDHLVDLSKLELPDWARLNWQFHQQRETFRRNTVRFGLQIGKIFGPIALRFGVFDGYSVGLGVDLEVPFPTDKFRWIMSFEGYDYRGWNRERDRSPHLKWLNRIYFLRNLYMTFGADDFVSQRNANVFFGAGLRFGDDDIKYFLPSIGSMFAFN